MSMSDAFAFASIKRVTSCSCCSASAFRPSDQVAEKRAILDPGLRSCGRRALRLALARPSSVVVSVTLGLSHDGMCDVLYTTRYLPTHYTCTHVAQCVLPSRSLSEAPTHGTVSHSTTSRSTAIQQRHAVPTSSATRHLSAHARTRILGQGSCLQLPYRSSPAPGSTRLPGLSLGTRGGGHGMKTVTVRDDSSLAPSEPSTPGIGGNRSSPDSTPPHTHLPPWPTAPPPPHPTPPTTPTRLLQLAVGALTPAQHV